MKVEIAILAQTIERIGVELQRCRACLADLLAESIQSTSAPSITPQPITQPRQTRTRLYGSGELSSAVLSVLVGVDAMAITDLLRVLQAQKPGTQMAAVRPCVTHLVQDGKLIRVGKGVYRLRERTPHLSVVQL
jgi:hypothetical protein